MLLDVISIATGYYPLSLGMEICRLCDQFQKLGQVGVTFVNGINNESKFLAYLNPEARQKILNGV